MRRNILFITYWSFEDALIQTYTLPYIKIISEFLNPDEKIYLISLEQTDGLFNKKELEKVNQELSTYKTELIPFKYHRFGMVAGLKWINNLFRLILLCKRKKISHLHSRCTPAGAIAYLLSFFHNRPLIIDSFEPHAEPMIESNTWKKNSLAYKLLFYLEKKQARNASHIISCVSAMKEYSKEKYDLDIPNLYSIPACVDFNLFNIDQVKDKTLLAELELKEKIVAVYAGKFGGSYLEQDFFDLLKVAYDTIGENFRALLLTNHSKKEIRNWMEKAGIPKEIIIQKFVPHHQIPLYLGLGDFGITPFVPVASKRYGSPIKTGEYWALGLPVIITKDISDDSEIIAENNIGSVLKELTNKEYQNAINQIIELMKSNETSSLRKKIRDIGFHYRNFDLAKSVYKRIYQ